MADLDEALERFQKTGLEYAGGLSNHGPMAAEALAALGHAALIPGWVDVYAPRLPPIERGRPLSEAERPAALGQPRRLPDWVATFEIEVGEAPWDELLRHWLPRLLSGLFAGAAHGLLRTAHAVRALEAGPSEPRCRELAHGLAYWAGRHQPLAGRPGSAPAPGRGARALFEAGVVIPVERRRPGLFFDAVRVLDDERAFADLVASFDGKALPPSELLSDLCVAAARAYLENPGSRIAYAHAVTAPSALRILAPYLGEADLCRAVALAAQAALALHAVSAEVPPRSLRLDAEVERIAQDPAEIRYRAACSLEEHAIKLSEACLREHALRADPILLAAAADAAVHLDAGAGRGAC